jgi:hypothetical protein
MSEGPRRFYTERVPAQFNRALERTLADEGEDGRLFRGLVSVDETIEVRVEGAADSPFHLNIEAGRMTVGNAPDHEPFAILVHDLAACEAIERESGDSALGFLGGMAGLSQEILFTRQRVDNLRMVNGTVRFSLTGAGGFALVSHFGGGEPAAEPDCELAVDAEIYARLRAGEIDAQEAFMSGKVDIAGDMQMAMQLALAVMSPD